MRHKRFYILIGLFMSFALLFSVLGSVLFYREYEKAHVYTYVMFFEENLRGIDITSAIMFRGVKIGQVRTIEITENAAGDNVIIPVYVEFFVEKHFSFTKNPIRLLIKKGFVAEMTSPNFLTGVSDIILNPTGEDSKTKLAYYRGYPIFPTRYSKTRGFTFENMIHSATDMFDGVNKFVDSKQMRSLLEAAQSMFSSVEHFIHSEKLIHTLNSATGMAESLKGMGKHIENFVDEADDYFPVMSMNLLSGIQKIGDAADALQVLSRYLTTHPESLFWGKH